MWPSLSLIHPPLVHLIKPHPPPLRINNNTHLKTTPTSFAPPTFIRLEGGPSTVQVWRRAIPRAVESASKERSPRIPRLTQIHTPHAQYAHTRARAQLTTPTGKHAWFIVPVCVFTCNAGVYRVFVRVYKSSYKHLSLMWRDHFYSIRSNLS